MSNRRYFYLFLETFDMSLTIRPAVREDAAILLSFIRELAIY